MPGMAGNAETGSRDRMAVAVILIVVGVAGLVGQVLDIQANMGGLIVTLLGVGFLAAFAFTRTYGYLVPGGPGVPVHPHVNDVGPGSEDMDR